MASTYVNDLRLNEMATGDGSGTWGTTTNLNLELIAEKFGSGSEALSDASTATITMADGASDAFRSLALTLTGSLSQACTVTLAPNTLSNVWMIKNSAGDAVTLTQGTGANVVIPNGFTKVVYTDGAGAGAAVTEAFTDLSVGGNLLIDGTTPKLTIGDGGAEDTAVVFDGNAQDFYIGLDDSADDLVFGKGSTLGTTQAMAIDENMDVAFGPTTNVTITNDGNEDTLTLVSTDADASAGPAISMYRNSSSPADNDFLGNVKFVGRNDNSQDVQYAEQEVYILDASDGEEDGLYNLNVMTAGTNTSYMQLKAGSGTVFNEDSNDIDFRVESNGKTHALFIDGGNNQVLLNTATARATSGVTPSTQIHGTGYNDASLSLIGDMGASALTAPVLFFAKTRGSAGGSTVVVDGDRLGAIFFNGADGTDINTVAASIDVVVDGTPGSDDLPGRINFRTSSDGSGDNAERMRIDSNGDVGIGTTTTLLRLQSVDSGTGSLPTDGTTGITTANTNIPFGVHNSSNSATYSGIALETRTTGASRWLIANEWQSTYLGDLVFSTRTGGSSSAPRLRMSQTELSVYPTTGASATGAIDVYGTNASSFGGSIIARSRFASSTDGTAYASLLRLYTTNTSNVLTEGARVDSSQNFLVGTTTSLGSISNGNRVTGGIFNTFADTVGAANNTATTMVSLSTAFATYIVCAGFNGVGNTNLYGASAIIHSDGTSHTMTQLVNPSNMTLSMSGSNVQATQTSGATLNISFSCIRIQ